MQKRLIEIDFLRVLSMFAVILIHVTSTFVYNESHLSLLGMNPAFFINQLTRFGVPFFILLSGFSLGIAPKEESYLSFLKKRCLRILPPYLIWTLIYELYNVGYDPRVLLHNLRNVRWAMGELLMGRAGPHLYFVIIILQFYLLYPLLKKAVDRAPTLSLLASFLSTLLLQGSYYLRFIGVTTASPASRFWITAPFWAFYFVAGMWLQKRPVETIKSKCKRFALILTALTLAFALLYSLSAAHTGFLDSINPALMLYVPLVFFCGIALWSVMEKVPFAPKVVSFLSAHSMGIYYNHVLLLCFFRTFPRLVNGLSGMLLLFLATTLSAIALACALRRLKGLLLKTAF